MHNSRALQADARKSGPRSLALYNLLARYRSTGRETVAVVSTLADARDALDKVVAAAYGWEWPLEEDELLFRLLALNLECAGEEV